MNLKITNIRKFIISILVVLILLISFSIFISQPALSYGNTEYKKYYISNGDTLWSIAKQENKYNEYYKNKDVRYIIYDIKNINKLGNSNIFVGQEIIIPTL